MKNVTVSIPAAKDATSKARSQQTCKNWGKAAAGPSVTSAGSGSPSNPNSGK